MANQELKSGLSYEFTVGPKALELGGYVVHEASGDAFGWSLRAFGLMEDPLGVCRTLRARPKGPNGVLNEESTLILRTEGNALILGGDHYQEAEVARLERIR